MGQQSHPALLEQAHHKFRTDPFEHQTDLLYILGL